MVTTMSRFWTLSGVFAPDNNILFLKNLLTANQQWFCARSLSSSLSAIMIRMTIILGWPQPSQALLSLVNIQHNNLSFVSSTRCDYTCGPVPGLGYSVVFKGWSVTAFTSMRFLIDRCRTQCRVKPFLSRPLKPVAIDLHRGE